MNMVTSIVGADTPPPNYMAQYGATLVANGYNILPIRPFAKSPGNFRHGEWQDYYGWSKHCTRPTGEPEIDIWSGWPGCAIGVACGRVLSIDIDILNAETAFEVEQIARRYLGDTPCVRIGRSPKRMLIYRTSESILSRKPKPLEILSIGTQFVAYAIHEQTKRPYEWPNQSLVETDISELPEVTERAVNAFFSEAWAAIPQDMKARPGKPGDVPSGYVGAAGTSLNGQRGTFDAIRAALQFIPNADLDRDSWVRIGHAIKGAIGEEGRDLFIDWSRSSSKSGKSGKSDTPERAWRGFKPTSIGAGTIYDLARKTGWTPDPDLVLNGAAAETPVDLGCFVKAVSRPILGGDAEPEQPTAATGWQAGFIQKSIAKTNQRSTSGKGRGANKEPSPEPIKPLPVPPEVYEVEGVIKLMMDHCLSTSWKPQPLLALGSAISIVSVASGRRYQTKSGLRTNIGIVGLAGSGAGKDHPLDYARKALHAAGLERCLGGEEIASGAGLLTSLSLHPARLFLIDELGMFISSLMNKRAAPYKAEIWSLLMKLYSRSSSTFKGKEYGDQKQFARIDLHQPHACIMGVSTHSTFWNALDNGAAIDGSLARLLVLVAEQNAVSRNRNQAPPVIPDEITSALKEIAAGVVGHNYGGNLTETPDGTMLATADMNAFTVPMDAAGAREMDALLDLQDDVWLPKAQNTPREPVIARIGENAARLALIHAVSRDPNAPVITARDVQWARTLTMYSAASLLRGIDRHVASNEIEARHKKILMVIRSAGKVTLTELGRKTQEITARERKEILGALKEMELIEETNEPGANGNPKPVTSYQAVPEDEPFWKLIEKS